jgi:hypothetical protein
VGLEVCGDDAVQEEVMEECEDGVVVVPRHESLVACVDDDGDELLGE